MVLSFNLGILDLIQLFCYYVMLYCAFLWFFVFLKNRKNFFREKRVRIKNYPSVTFLVPAHNEEKHIKKCLTAILNLDYPKDKLKVICINDGSTDRTLEICKSIKDPRLTIIDKPNTGKADSLNQGLKLVDSEYVVSMDADSYPERDYLKKVLPYFNKKDIVAVTPALKVKETRTLMQKIQWVEYIFSIYLRKAFAFFNCQYVLPGPGSICKTEVVREVGGWDKESLVEDTELAFKLHSKGYKMENSPNAYVTTEAPETFKDLFKQRIRWYRGYLQTNRKYFYMFFNMKYGNLGFFVLPVNFLWIFILCVLLFLPIYNFAVNLNEFLYRCSLVGFTWPSININFDILYLSFYVYFSILFFFLSVLIIFVSAKVSSEKINLKTRKWFYAGYLFIYPLLYSIFWLSAIFCEIFKVKKKW